MRRLRWKRSYLTGIAWVDEGNEALVGIVTDIASALQAKEHCQDMADLYEVLVERVQERFGRKAPTGVERSFDNELEALLKTYLPLPARDTAACRDCGICESTQQWLRQWLIEGEKVFPRYSPAEMAESDSV